MATYTDMLAAYGVTVARPGGKDLTNYVLQSYPPQGENILELGAGLGETANFISNNYTVTVTAIDSNEKMIAKAKRKHKDNKNIQWLHCNFNSFLPEKLFDHVIIESVLSFTDINSSLEKIGRLLKKNGTLYLLEPIYLGGLSDQDFAEYKGFYGFQDILTEKEWIKALTDHQFAIKKRISSTEFENNCETDPPYPELVLDETMEQKYVNILSKHLELTNNYLAYFDYAYFICEKKP